MACQQALPLVVDEQTRVWIWHKKGPELLLSFNDVRIVPTTRERELASAWEPIACVCVRGGVCVILC